MSDPILALAQTLASQPTTDGSPAETLATALLGQIQDNTAMSARLLEANRRANALAHENDELRERLARAERVDRAVPASMFVYCERGNLTCPTRLELNGPPPDSEVPTWLRLAGWGVNEKGERLCPKCK